MDTLSQGPAPHPEKFTFFTLRSFEKDVGETLRIYGVLNALAAAGHEVILLSNAQQFTSFHPAVRHISIGREFTGKRLLQGLTGLLSARLVRAFFKRTFKHIEAALVQAKTADRTIFFFDYLDNTIAYILKQTTRIKEYINDVHGIATAEFLNNKRQSGNLLAKGYFHTKYWLANRLDRKVFENAGGFLFGSSSMKDYFRKTYNIKYKKNLILPYLLDAYLLDQRPETHYRREAAEALATGPEDFIFMFVGSYKATAGVENLIVNFSKIHKYNKNCKLVLIGDGANRQHCEKVAQISSASGAITFLDPVRYKTLPAYYYFSHVIVCPDIDNPFSQYVVHIKYFDALSTGKLVINGSFKSVMEVNSVRPLSLLFDPTDSESLYEAMYTAYCRYPELTVQFQDSAERVRQHFTYRAHTEALCKLNNMALT